MNFYKSYLKILLNQKASIASLILIFIFMFFIYGGDIGFSSLNENNEFKNRKLSHLVIDEDGSALSAKTMEFLKENGKIKLIEKISKINIDEVYNAEYRGIIVFEKGFESSVLRGEELKLKYYASMQELTQALGQRRLYSFLNAFYGYHHFGFSMEESFERAMENLSYLTEVEIHKTNDGKKNVEINSKLGGLGNATIIFSLFFSVAVFNILFVEFGRNEVNLRAMCSATSINKLNISLVTFSLFINLFIVTASLSLGMLFYKNELLKNNSILFMGINIFVSGLLAMSISFFTASIFKNKRILGTINGIFGTVLMFVGGVYMPLFLFPSWFKQIAQFTPYYWFSEANALFFINTPISGDRLYTFIQCVFLQIIFFVLFITVGLIVKNKRRADIS